VDMLRNPADNRANRFTSIKGSYNDTDVHR